jgi:hypothetical protein
MMGHIGMNITSGLEVERRYFAPDGETSPEPALFIICRQSGERKVGAIIPLGCAYKYNPRTQTDILEAYAAAKGIAIGCGLPDDPKSLGRLVNFIADKLPSLFTMPPWESVREQYGQAERVIGQADVIIDGERRVVDIKE